MELDLQSLYGLHVHCAQLYSLTETPQPFDAHPGKAFNFDADPDKTSRSGSTTLRRPKPQIKLELKASTVASFTDVMLAGKFKFRYKSRYFAVWK
jgi:hypothetical protein